MAFKRMSKMETTEPSVDEAGKGMKKGGKACMADGGVAPLSGGALPLARQIARRQPAMVSDVVNARPRGASLMRPQPAARPSAGIPAQAMGAAKKGGVMKKAEGGESRAEHAAEMKRMGRIEKELKSHEDKPASKGHKGLKTGGVANAQGGYKKGGIAKFATGGVVKGGVAGYKAGGACMSEGGFTVMKKSKSW